MSTIIKIAPHVANFGFGQIIMDTIADLRAARAKRAAYDATLRALSEMTDKDLADIGVSRLSIRDIALKAAYGERK
ncbi:MAG: DUF1127 domain-containing protein [Yoonia sp.]|nr:DUF1127 domain-containing protein [Yoonia sp.]